MIFSGKNYRTTPNAKEISFSFENLYLDHSGSASIGFSGEGNVLKFTFLNKRILDFSGNYVSSYETNKPISISGDISKDYYRYFIDDNLFADGRLKNDFKIQKFIVDSTGCAINVSPSFNCRNISNSFFSQGLMRPSGNFSGYLKNDSDIEFKVFNFTATPRSLNDQNPFSGVISGNAPPKGKLNFNLIESRGDDLGATSSLFFDLNTNIGLLRFPVEVNRAQGLGSDFHVFSLMPIDTEVPLFLGISGENSFVFSGASGSKLNSLQYVGYDENVSLISKALSISLSPHYPAQSGSYTGSYMTGVEITNSGYYNIPPFPKFNSYHSLTGISFNKNNLFMPDCPSVMPFLFSGDGDRASGSGNFYLTDYRVGLLDYNDLVFVNGQPGNENNLWKQITGYSINNNGSGFENKIEIDILNIVIDQYSEAYTGCFDVPSVLGFTRYIFSGLDLQAKKHDLANYAYGYSILNGTGATGVRSVVITNPGSGYNALYQPRINFIRNINDGSSEAEPYGSNKATADVVLNASGKIFNFFDTWDMSTGEFFNELVSFRENSFTGSNSYISSGHLKADQASLFLKMDYRSIDEQNRSIALLKISGVGGLYEEMFITGSVMYSVDSGLLVTPIEPIDTQTIDVRFLIEEDNFEIDL